LGFDFGFGFDLDLDLDFGLNRDESAKGVAEGSPPTFRRTVGGNPSATPWHYSSGF
jgi:hypothetical protein